MPDWPHAPVHRLDHAGAYMVTAGTYQKEHFFRDPGRLTHLQNLLLETCVKWNWNLQAWAVFSNHYHFVATTTGDAHSLSAMTQQLHYESACFVNGLENCPGRKVWHEFWDSHLTFQRSYLARLNYVHQNPVRHGLVQLAHNYQWCSAAWFQRIAGPAFYKSVTSFKIDLLKVPDEF
jgi:putative transposase